MICPLLMMGLLASHDESFKLSDTDCEEENCAWWDEKEERCAVPQLVRELDRMTDRINDLDLNLREQFGNLQEIIHRIQK